MTTLRVVPDGPLTLAEKVAKRIRVFLAEYNIKQVAVAERHSTRRHAAQKVADVRSRWYL